MPPHRIVTACPARKAQNKVSQSRREAYLRFLTFEEFPFRRNFKKRGRGGLLIRYRKNSSKMSTLSQVCNSRAPILLGARSTLQPRSFGGQGGRACCRGLGPGGDRPTCQRPRLPHFFAIHTLLLATSASVMGWGERLHGFKVLPVALINMHFLVGSSPVMGRTQRTAATLVVRR